MSHTGWHTSPPPTSFDHNQSHLSLTLHAEHPGSTPSDYSLSDYEWIDHSAPGQQELPRDIDDTSSSSDYTIPTSVDRSTIFQPSDTDTVPPCLPEPALNAIPPPDIKFGYYIRPSNLLLYLLADQSPAIVHGSTPLPPLPSGYVGVVLTDVPIPTFPEIMAPPPLLVDPIHSGRKQTARVACTNCREIKKKCDNGRPCGPCQKRGKADTCVSAPRKKRAVTITKHTHANVARTVGELDSTAYGPPFPPPTAGMPTVLQYLGTPTPWNLASMVPPSSSHLEPPLAHDPMHF